MKLSRAGLAFCSVGGWACAQPPALHSPATTAEVDQLLDDTIAQERVYKLEEVSLAYASAATATYVFFDLGCQKSSSYRGDFGVLSYLFCGVFAIDALVPATIGTIDLASSTRTESIRDTWHAEGTPLSVEGALDTSVSAADFKRHADALRFGATMFGLGALVAASGLDADRSDTRWFALELGGPQMIEGLWLLVTARERPSQRARDALHDARTKVVPTAGGAAVIGRF